MPYPSAEGRGRKDPSLMKSRSQQSNHVTRGGTIRLTGRSLLSIRVAKAADSTKWIPIPSFFLLTGMALTQKSPALSNILYMYDQLPRNAYLTGRQLVASPDKDEVGRVKAAVQIGAWTTYLTIHQPSLFQILQLHSQCQQSPFDEVSFPQPSLLKEDIHQSHSWLSDPLLLIQFLKTVSSFKEPSCLH